jgi:hypothetical protein
MSALTLRDRADAIHHLAWLDDEAPFTPVLATAANLTDTPAHTGDLSDEARAAGYLRAALHLACLAAADSGEAKPVHRAITALERALAKLETP